MTFDHVGSEELKNLISEVMGKDEIKIVSNDVMKEFYRNRITKLEAEADELEIRDKELRISIEKDIQQIILTKGAELLSIKQMYKVICKESGVCETRLKDLEEKTKNK